MLTRRDLLGSAGHVGLAAVLARLWPARVLAAQAAQQPWGKNSLVARSVRPPDYETPVGLLDSFITPIEHFYVRSHLPIPATIDVDGWRLDVGGEVASPLALSVADLRQMPRVTVTVTLECAGNGRALFDPPVAGIQWQKGAVGTARWTGVRMGDVLARAGASAAAAFVFMGAADRPLGTMPDFLRQLPMQKALDPDTIVAYEMNGQPIPQVHGLPLRAIVPGWEGAYSVKWINQLTASAKPSDSFWVASAYRYPTRRVAPGATVDPKDMAPLTGLVVKSLITSPAAGASLAPGPVPVAGFAWAGERDIAKVDLSIDNGATWQPARLTGEQAKYTWRRFDAQVDAKARGSLLILSRATDTAGRAQPAVSHWNPSGYLWNQYDSVRVEIA